MPRPTDPVKWVCYDDDLTVWVSGVSMPDLEVSLNSYLEEITGYLNDISLLICTLNSSVTLLTPDTYQAKTHLSILIGQMPKDIKTSLILFRMIYLIIKII